MEARVEAFFKELGRALEGSADALTVEWRRDEALGQIQLGDDFYVFVVVSWGGGEYYMEFMVGDENAVIQSRHLPLLGRAVEVIRAAYDLAVKRGLIHA